MTVQQATRQLLFLLFHIYEEREARNVADLVMEHVTEWKKIDRILNKALPLSDKQEDLLAKFTEELMAHKPVQYVLNEAWFCGMRLYVDEHVLIPRPETEELVSWLIESGVGSRESGIGSREHQEREETGLRIMEIGTGSGCIAIALKKKLPAIQVYSCDISEKALEVARRNATTNCTNIDLIVCNFLDDEQRNALPAVDIIVSNPPYVPLRDKENMSLSVLQYEPHLALFVENYDALAFYTAIAGFGQTHLPENGQIFAELHEEMGEEVKNIFISKGFTDIELREDMQGKVRLIKAVVPCGSGETSVL